MLSRFQWKYLKVRIEKLDKAIFEYEMTSPIYNAWKKWMDLPQEEKNKLTLKWENYYQTCQKSEAGKDFFKCLKAFEENNTVLVKKYASRAKKRLEINKWLKKPSSCDPCFFPNKMGKYWEAKQIVKDLKNIYNEFLPVYGFKNDIEETL